MTEPLFTGINHVCVVTGDVERAVDAWLGRYGVGPWELWTYDEDKIEATVGDRPVRFGMRVAMCTLANAKIELIQPLDDRSPYAESLARHGGADHVHHIRFDVADYDDARARLAALGHDELLRGRFAGGVPGEGSLATYFDTTGDLGLVAEVAHLPEGFQRLGRDELRG